MNASSLQPVLVQKGSIRKRCVHSRSDRLLRTCKLCWGGHLVARRPPRNKGVPNHNCRRSWLRLSSGDVSVLCGQISQSKGLVSIDRSEAAALLSTTPRLRPRSSANDLAPLHCMGWISFRYTHTLFRAREEPCCCGFATADAEGGRSASIVASQRRGAYSIVTFLGGILT